MIKEWYDGRMIVLTAMPRSISEAVTENEDGSYTIFLNENLSDKKRIEAYAHALRHISGDDFEKPDVQEIESEAHKKA